MPQTGVSEDEVRRANERLRARLSAEQAFAELKEGEAATLTPLGRLRALSPARKWTILALLVLLLAAASRYATAPLVAVEPPPSSVTLENLSVVPGPGAGAATPQPAGTGPTYSGASALEGVLHNRSGRAIASVVFEIELKDPRGHIAGTVIRARDVTVGESRKVTSDFPIMDGATVTQVTPFSIQWKQ